METEQLLAIVAVVNAVGANLALLIHAFRVPYRESAAQEQTAAIDAVTRQQHERHLDSTSATRKPDPK